MKPDLAVIDIGSNSVRLMLGKAEDGRVRALRKELSMTRLARGIGEDGRLAPDRVRDTIEAIRTYKQRADAFGIPVIAYATSAVRDAADREDFVAQVLKETGAEVHVLSGEEEGAFAYQAATGGTGTVFDIGGGSFQIVAKDRALSFPCGCVRAKEQCDASDPKTLEQALFAWMDARTDLPECVPGPVYGVGGTITTLGALLALQQTFDPQTLETITHENLAAIIERLAAIPEPTRMRLPLLGRRGDVILQGATVLQYMMRKTGTEAVIPSDRDGTEGIAEAFIKGKL